MFSVKMLRGLDMVFAFDTFGERVTNNPGGGNGVDSRS
jgi:hypothetical protein